MVLALLRATQDDAGELAGKTALDRDAPTSFWRRRGSAWELRRLQRCARTPSSRQRFRSARFDSMVLRPQDLRVCRHFPARQNAQDERESTMPKRSDHEVSASAISRRSFLQVSASATFAGAFAAPTLAAAAEGGLVALVHTQAAGDNGPIDSMIAALKKLSQEKNFPIRTIYAQDAATYGTIFKSLADANAAIIVATFNEVAEPIKALAPKYPKTKWIQIFGDPIDPADAEFRDGVLRLLSRLLSLRSLRRQDVEDGQDRLHRRREPAASERGREFAQGRDRLRRSETYLHAGLCGLVSGPGQRTRDRQPDVSGRRRLHSDRFGGHRHRHHPGGERRRRPNGQRDLARAIQDRARRPSRRWSRSTSASRSTTRCRRRSGPTSRAGIWPPVSAQA